MSSLSSQEESEESGIQRKNPRRNCLLKNSEKSEETCSDSDDHESIDESDEIDNDRESDEDFSLINKPKKKKKKRKVIEKEKKEKLERKIKVKRNFAPSFDDVLRAQITHAQKFVNYDDYDSEEERLKFQESEEELEEEIIKEKSPSPPPQVLPKRRKIIIYPWNPIGITGGKYVPINDVSKLNDIDPYTNQDEADS